MRDMYCLNLAQNVSETESNDASNTAVESDSTFNPNNIETYYDFSTLPSETSDDTTTTFELQDEYMPATKFKNLDSSEFDESELYDFDVNYKAQLVPHGTIHYPKNWEIYFCARGKFKKFPPPKTDASGLLSKFLIF